MAACAREAWDGGGGAAASAKFTEALARGYELVSDYENYVVTNETVGAHFAQKARQVRSGRAVAPDAAPSQNEELQKARGTLVAALAGRGRNSADHLAAAEAQLNYDCWVSRAVRALPSARYCRDRFLEAVKHIEVSGHQHFAVYFDYNTATPDKEAFKVIKKAAAAYVDSDDWRIHVTGHADAKGDKQSNILLSMRRAMAVRNALAQNGVDIDKVVIGAVGNAGLDAAEDTDTASRRVDITITPVYMDQADAGPDIKSIVPHYFGD